MISLIRQWLLGKSGALSAPRLDKDGDFIQTERIVGILAASSGLGLFFLIILGFGFPTFATGFGFVTWSILGAGASLFCGAAIGLLFGLPNVRRIEVVAKGGEGAVGSGGSSLADGYSESTNLEQVADWLTKIIIGLTLTQYYMLQLRFNELSTNLTSAMYGKITPPDAMVPGGTIVTAYTVLGFLTSYLLMRRYFISEMVQGRRDAENKAKKAREEKAEVARAAGVGLAQTSPVTATTPHDIQEGARALADKAAQFAAPQALPEARNLVQEAKDVEYPDDPWRGKFGGAASDGTASLSASVTALESDPSLFRLVLTVAGPPSYSGQSATFYLHPTFGSEPQRVAFGADGKAVLELFAYGAFTVGVLLENGNKLELNLATQPDAPELFRQR